jgi:S1-C subfamily serine protease
VLRKNLAMVTVALLCCLAAAQVTPTKRGAYSTKRVPPIRSGQATLEARYSALSCALVVIQSGPRLGTGFYISAEGDLVTALHVIGDKTVEPQGVGWKINLLHPPTVTIRNHKEEFSVVVDGNVQADGDTWATDITVLKTGKPTDCWLKIGDDKIVKPGQHVIAMGFPGLAFGSLSLYTGIVSAKLKSGLIMGTLTNGQSFQQTNDFIRVQMPISAGVSGAPVINDKNEAIAVVTQAGASTPDLDALVQSQRTKDLAAGGPSKEPEPLSAVAHLAEVFRDFASPGYGDSVPLSYLPAKTVQANQKLALSSRPRQ